MSLISAVTLSGSPRPSFVRLSLAAGLMLFAVGCTEQMDGTAEITGDFAVPATDSLTSVSATAHRGKGGRNYNAAPARPAGQVTAAARPANPAIRGADHSLALSAAIRSLPNSAEANAVAKLYQARANQPVFIRNGRWTQDAQQLMQLFGAAELEGLTTRHYVKGALRGAAAFPDASTYSPAAIAFDVQLTASAITYLRDVNKGRFNPEGASLQPMRLVQAAETQNITSVLRYAGPKGMTYQGLRLALGQRYASLSASKKNRLRLNMERERWDHENSAGPYVRVNIPAQQLEAFDNGAMAFRMPVSVGRRSRQTPALRDRIVNIKYSPDWTVPTSIIKKDFFPRLQKNRGYLADRGYKVRLNGKTVNPRSLNISSPAALAAYSISRPAGRSNPLGGARFSLTNSRAIYLHDTPSDSQFGRDSRLLSSGCVRVSEPVTLSKWLHQVNGQPVSTAAIRKKMKRSAPNFAYLGNGVPVSLSYLTAWVDGNGTLRFAPDVYGKDKKLAKRMGLSL